MLAETIKLSLFLRFPILIFLMVACNVHASESCDENQIPPDPLMVYPGETYQISDGDACEYTVSDCDLGNFCFADAYLDIKRFQLKTSFATAVDGTKRAKATMYNRFQLEGDPDEDRVLRANLSGQVSWDGKLVIELGSGYIESSIDVSMKLIDLTDNNRVVAQKKMLSKSCEVDSLFPVICIKSPEGSGTYNLAVDLTRGHEYKFEFIAECKSDIGFPAATIGVLCLFNDHSILGGSGISRSDIRLNIARDLEEELNLLWELYEELDVRSRLHTHEYRTGKGKGHNKVRATSSEPANP
jgi:hypothetical protein